MLGVFRFGICRGNDRSGRGCSRGQIGVIFPDSSERYLSKKIYKEACEMRKKTQLIHGGIIW